MQAPQVAALAAGYSHLCGPRTPFGKGLVPGGFAHLPLAAEGLGWLLPVALTLLVAVVFDRLRGAPAIQIA